MRYFCKRGTPYEVYFGICEWAPIPARWYWFERLLMRNRCLATETQLKARGFDLHEAIQENRSSWRDQEEYRRICSLVAKPPVVQSSPRRPYANANCSPGR